MSSDEKIKIVDLDDSVSVRKRMEPRCYPILNVPADTIWTIPRRGVCAGPIGPRCSNLGNHATAKENLFIELHQLGEVRLFSFEAECVRVHSEDLEMCALP